MSALKIAVVTGGHSYEVQPFHALFRVLPGVDAYVQHLDDFTSSPQEVRDGYDVLVFYIMPHGAPADESPWFSGKPKSAFEHLGETAQGIIMLHHAILAYPDWPVWDEMVGMTGRVISEYAHDERIPVYVTLPTHPIVQGISSWTITDETYVLHDPGPDSQVLLTTDHPHCMKSLAWTRTFRNGRIFCYQSGHDHQTYEDANFQAVLTNGIRWAAENMILQIEELSLNAWPAPQTLLYDGWVLRFAGGYTRRANSINPIYASTLPIEEKLIACEQMYRGHGLPVTFKMTPDSQPANLDEALAERGYQADAHTSVQLLDLNVWSSEFPPRFSFASGLTDDWFAAFCMLSGTPDKHIAPMRQILSLLLPTHCFAMLQADSQPVACGMAVVQNGFVGMFDIVVAGEQRRKGHGRDMMKGLLAWGKQQGAHTSYLQVMCNNPPALHLYANLGYQEVYRYWYRVSDSK